MSRPDCLLVRPWAPSAVPPDALVEDSLGVGFISASLRQAGYRVMVLDAFTFQLQDEDVVRCVLEISPAVLGISLHSFADYRHCVAIADGVAAQRPDIYRVLGGEHATFLARPILEKHASVNAVVAGEGEKTIQEIVQRVVSGRATGLISGAVTRDTDGSILDGGARRAIEDLDALPWPHKDTVELAIQAGRPVAVSLLTGRGCTHKCTFCTANTFLRLGGGVVWRRRSPKQVADEMEDLIRRYIGRPGVHPMIQFQDVIFLGASPQARRWTAEFLDELEARGLRTPYYLMSRAEAILANADLMPRLAATGLSSVEVGIETGVDRILQAYNKQNSTGRTEDAIQILREHAICYDASGFIMFDPRMTLEELRTSALFLRRIDHATWDRYITKLQVFPGTVIRSQLIEEGLYRSDGELDDVYGYRFVDRRVWQVARHTWFYDDSIRRLDCAMRSSKAEIARRVRHGEPVGALSNALDLAQQVYCEHFLALIGLADAGELETRFEEQMRVFLVQVEFASVCLDSCLLTKEDSVAAAGLAS
ncbi:MAG: hypothetical protein C5B51_32585 [Terriglobia bacterium]|nr:MAG: hypothetical protein C5B51_32585 [Terriglobia bacterium]